MRREFVRGYALAVVLLALNMPALLGASSAFGAQDEQQPIGVAVRDVTFSPDCSLTYRTHATRDLDSAVNDEQVWSCPAGTVIATTPVSTQAEAVELGGIFVPLSGVAEADEAAMLMIAVVTPSTSASAPPNADAHTPEGAPVAVGCAVEPRTIDDVNGLAVQASPAPSIFMGELPSGQTADAEVVDQITRTVAERIECQRQGDWLRWLALSTDDHIRGTALPGAAPMPQEAPTPEPQAALEGLRLLAIEHVSLLDDGRVSAIVTIGGAQAVEDEHPAPGRTSLMFFRNVDGRWLVDAAYSRIVVNGRPTLVADAYPPAIDMPATPAR